MVSSKNEATGVVVVDDDDDDDVDDVEDGDVGLSPHAASSNAAIARKVARYMPRQSRLAAIEAK